MMAPIASDLRISGRVAALHAMNDVFACLARPVGALIQLVVDVNESLDEAAKLVAGVLDTCVTEKVKVLGGHTLRGLETLIGLTVIGAPRSSAPPGKKGSLKGDAIFLSKPLGVGLVARASLRSACPSRVMDVCLSFLQTSNSRAAVAASKSVVHASTDISGFGLLGHLAEMLHEDLGIRISYAAIPVIDGAKELTPDLFGSGCISENWDYAMSLCGVNGAVTDQMKAVLCDPQTNGGLVVIAAPSSRTLLSEAGYVEIGVITGSGSLEIVDA
jgi:selenide,water dikinase